MTSTSHSPARTMRSGPQAVWIACTVLTLGSLGQVGLAAAEGPAAAVGPGLGFLQKETLARDETLLLNSDETYENGYAWRFGGIVAPDYGAFAERYEGATTVTAAVFDLTQIGMQADQTMDVYVWADGGNVPGAVVCAVIDVTPDPIAFWPTISRHLVDLPNCATDGTWWVGQWGNWPFAASGWFVAADTDGPGGGRPVTNVAPGIGYPTGWQDVSIVWGATAALGIGALVDTPPPPLTLQDMIDDAADGETVIVPPGVYAGPGNKRLDFLGKDLVLRSEAGPAATIIDCEDDGRAFHFHSGETAEAVVDGFTIRHGAEPAAAGGAILVTGGSSPTLTNLVVENCTALSGAVLAVEGGSVHLSRSRLTSNAAILDGGGGIAATNATVVLDTVVQRSGREGAIVANASVVNVYGGDIRGCSSTFGGGAVRAENGSSATLDFTTLGGNLGARGGAVLVDATSSVTITRSTLGSNRALGNGGAVSVDGVLVVERSILWTNCAGGVGDEIEAASGSVEVICSAVDPTGVAGSVTFVGDQVTDDPMLCGPVSCASAPTAAGNLYLQEGSPGLPVYSPCGHLLGSLWIRCPVPVVPDGACCLATGECFLTVEELCSPYGGFYAGDGSTCAPGSCDPAEAPEVGNGVVDRLRLEITGANPTAGALRFAIESYDWREVSADLFDPAGRRMASLFRGTIQGRHELSWDGTGDRGARPANGVYYLRVRAGTDVISRPIVIAN